MTQSPFSAAWDQIRQMWGQSGENDARGCPERHDLASGGTFPSPLPRVNLDRRGFLALLGGAAVGVAAAPYLDLDRLLWVPEEKTIFLPAVEEFGLVTPDWMTHEALRILKGELGLASRITCEYDRFFPDGAHIGDSVRVTDPSRWSGMAASRHVAPPSRAVTLTDQLNVTVQSVNPRATRADVRTRQIAPAIELLAQSLKHKKLNTFAPLTLSVACDMASQATDLDTGLSIRFVQAYDVYDGEVIGRFDVLGGRA